MSSPTTSSTGSPIDLPNALPNVGNSVTVTKSDGTKETVLRTSADTIVTIDENGGQYTVQIEHIDPANPQLPSPTAQPGAITTQSLTLTYKDNPFFAVSFAAVFAMVMLEVETTSRQTSYLESQVNLQNYKKLMAIATDVKDMTLLSFDLQAQEKMIQAVSSFVSAAISGMTALRTLSGPGVARQQAEKSYKDELDREEASLKKLQTAKKQGYTVVSAEDGEEVFKPKPTREEQERFDREIEAKEKNVAHLKANKESIIKDREHPFLQRHEQETRLIGETINKAVDGIFKTLEAAIIKERALPEALKAYWEQLTSLIRTFMDNTIRYRDSANDAFAKTLDLFTKVIDSNSKAFSAISF